MCGDVKYCVSLILKTALPKRQPVESPLVFAPILPRLEWLFNQPTYRPAPQRPHQAPSFTLVEFSVPILVATTATVRALRTLLVGDIRHSGTVKVGDIRHAGTVKVNDIRQSDTRRL